MGNALFDGGRDAFLNGSVDWVNDTINGVLVDLDDITGTIKIGRASCRERV